jgi:hypothetical protein
LPVVATMANFVEGKAILGWSSSSGKSRPPALYSSQSRGQRDIP